MTTVQAFNTMLKNFLGELADVFPEEAQITTFLHTFDSLVTLNPRGPLELFVDSLTPHAPLAMAKDPALFDKLQFPGGIDFQRLWRTDISDNTREAIWQYINLLFLLGTTVRNMPPEMLQGIEAMAQSCAAQMESGELDFGSLGAMLMGGMGGAGGGAGGLAGLLGGLGGDEDADAGAGAGGGARGAGGSGTRKKKKTSG